MKYAPPLYAAALLEVLEASPAKDHSRIIKRFLSLIVKNGDASRANSIVSEVQKSLIKKEGGRVIDIEFARPVSKKMQQELTGQFSKKDFIRFSFNESLIAGVRITIDQEREYDNSFSSRLRRMFTPYAL